MLSQLTRRSFLQLSALVGSMVTAARAQTPRPSRPAPAVPTKAKPRQPYIGIQVGAVSFVDEGTEKVLDIFQEKAQVNTLWLNTYTYERGTGGRQVPGQPFPDHGVQEYDVDYKGGAFYDYNKKYFGGTILNDFRSPDYRGLDILKEVLPKATKRGIQVYVWDYNNAYPSIPALMPNFPKVLEVDVYGRRANTPCFNNSDYRNHLFSKIEDYLKSYPEISGIAWGCERMGPLNNMIGGGWDSKFITCFCSDCTSLARDRGIQVERARQGYQALDAFFQKARKGIRPNDGFFVAFWRLLLKYPEILAWETFWTDSYHRIRSEIYGVAHAIAPDKPVGWHIMHMNSFNPFYRAEEDYAEMKNYSDFLKVVMYNNCGGPRLVRYLHNLHETIFRDAEPTQSLPLLYRMLDYSEASFEKLSTSGLSSDYVYRETKRALASVGNEIPVYPGIDVDIPTEANQKKTTPEDVRRAVKAAFDAGAQGIIISRKYAEMKLANLAGVGAALSELGIKTT